MKHIMNYHTYPILLWLHLYCSHYIDGIPSSSVSGDLCSRLLHMTKPEFK